MAAETAPPPRFDAQHLEEDIDYSDDEPSSGPIAAAKDSDYSSGPADIHFAAVVPQNAETSMEPGYQTIDVQAMADTVTVASGAQLENESRELSGADNFENPPSIAHGLEDPDGASFDGNEISWEDGSNNGQVADHADGRLEAEKGDWQLVDEGTHFSDNAQPAGESEVQDGQLDSLKVDQTVQNPAGFTDDADIRHQDDVHVDDSAGQEQNTVTRDVGADDLHEIDYFGDEDVPADTSADVIQMQSEGDLLDQNFSSAHAQEAEERGTGESQDSVSQSGAYKVVSVNGDNADDAQELEGGADEEQEYAAARDDPSAPERMEYEDVLADAQSTVSVDTPSNEEMELPVITVTYKGVEYPFFYNSPDSEGKECFFDDISLLHCKMEGVLAGFRRELADELGPSDELVFQVDELGLEFSESSHPDVFSDITLGQIISVFDSLVKNQDPDASKPLYANLLTRPNCKKRWLSLVDDAYNGKSLDEVSYFFSSQARSEMPEIVDDEAGMTGEEDNADAAAWPDSPAESDRGSQNDYESQPEHEGVDAEDDVGPGIDEANVTEAEDAADAETFHTELAVAEDPEAEATLVDADIPLMDESTAVADIDEFEGNEMTDMVGQEVQTSDENGNADSSLAITCFYPEFCVCPSCASIFTADQMVEQDDFAYESPVRTRRHMAQRTLFDFSRPEVERGNSLRSHFIHEHSQSNASIDFSSTLDADVPVQAAEIDASNEPINWITEGADPLGAAVDEDHIPDDEDSTAVVDQIVGGTDGNSANKVTPNTSATSTLSGDEVMHENNELDLNAGIPENQFERDVTGDHGDELAEIDWREFPGQGENDLVESPSVVGKRPRSDVDDLLDDEAQNDVKRRRS